MIHYVKQIGDLRNSSNEVVRTAVRGIILRDDLILLIRTAKGDLKFPGGGLEENETFEEALIREIREETGYVNVKVKTDNPFATYIERKIDKYVTQAIFESRSYYSFVNVIGEEPIEVKLDHYEELLQFQAEWIPIKDAIIQNTYALFSEEEPNDWVEREITILQALLEWKKSQ